MSLLETEDRALLIRQLCLVRFGMLISLMFPLITAMPATLAAGSSYSKVLSHSKETQKKTLQVDYEKKKGVY